MTNTICSKCFGETTSAFWIYTGKTHCIDWECDLHFTNFISIKEYMDTLKRLDLISRLPVPV